MKVKICGLKRPEDISYVNEVKPDYIGFVFADSRRQVSVEQAESLSRQLNPGIIPIGVFVNDQIDKIAYLLDENIIQAVQLHGDEDNSYIKELRTLVKGKPIIQAVRIKDKSSLVRAGESIADYLLLDTYSPHTAGGTGETFNWDMIEDIQKPYFLAGGLTVENVEEAVRKSNPYCLDLSSGVETNQVKDRDKIMEVVLKIRSMK